MSIPRKTKLVISIKMDTFDRIKKSLPGAYSSSDVYAKAHVQDWIGDYIDKMRGLKDCAEERDAKERAIKKKTRDWLDVETEDE